MSVYWTKTFVSECSEQILIKSVSLVHTNIYGWNLVLVLRGPVKACFTWRCGPCPCIFSRTESCANKLYINVWKCNFFVWCILRIYKAIITCLSATDWSVCARKLEACSCQNITAEWEMKVRDFNPLNPELNPICYLLALLGAHHFLHVSRIRVNLLTFRRLMSYIHGAHILDVSRSHTTTHHSR